MRWTLVIGAALCCCNHNNGATQKEQPLERGIVILESEGRTVRVEVEVARTPEQRTRGLMFRKELKPHHGMLFIFDREEQQSFWMKNTYIPLDMIFIDDGLKVVGVVENAEPMTTVSRRVDGPSRYVLEVRGGFAGSQGIAAGTRVKLELPDK
jgi:uncharacterized membrane protein (UPF0127 family)